MPPLILYEDEHLLVVNKPAGWNTHAPSPYAGEGIYDWLKHREPRWANLAIIHRLDKESSGVMVFGNTSLANRSLTEQFAGRTVRKTYLLWTDRTPKQHAFTAKSKIIRVGEHYASSPHGEPAETRFGVPALASAKGLDLLKYSPDRLKAEFRTIEAEPITGRTHQIRVHATEHGFPILGDTLYGGTPFQRVCLHAKAISFKHPATNEVVAFTAPVDFDADARMSLRMAIIEPDATDSFRLVHGASDGWSGLYVDRFGDFVLSQSEAELTHAQHKRLARMPGVKSAYHKILNRQVRTANSAQASPRLVFGKAAPEHFEIRENGAKFEISFGEGYSVGLFLDQRDNRRRLLTNHIAAGFGLHTSGSRLEVLNTFAYTCGFSVCAALGGAKTTSLDFSKKYLTWGKRNFVLNRLDPTEHDLIYGDAFNWLKRLANKQRIFDAVLLDPPTFSQSKEGGVFRAEKDYVKLVTAALRVLKRTGVLFASTNAAGWSPEDFLAQVVWAVRNAGRKTIQLHYVPQPPDFPITRDEPAYLKTVWLRVG